MALIDRLADIVGGAGRAIARAADALRDKPAPKVDPSPNPAIVAPSVSNLPGVTHWTGGIPTPTNEQLTQALQTVEAFFGKVSYDAGPSMTRFSSYPATDLTPEKIVIAQSEAVAGFPLRWEEMVEQTLSRDSHLMGLAQTRVNDVIKGSWRLLRSMNDEIAGALCNFSEMALRGADELEDALAWLLLGNAYSYNAVEITWKREKISFPDGEGGTIGPFEAIVPARLDPVHPKHFRFNLRTDEPLLWLGNNGISLVPGKFVFFKGEGYHPITERRGYMWQCIWLSMFRSIGWAGWASFVERFGLPVPLIEYEGTIAQYKEYKQAYQDILNSLGTGQGAIYPANAAKFDIKDPASGGRASDPHSALSDACDAAQSVRVLGATLTAKIGNVGSFAASNTHVEVKYALEEADARRLWSAVRSQLISPLLRINAKALAEAFNAAGYGDVVPEMIARRVPIGVHRVPREIDPMQRAQIITLFAKNGLKIGMERCYYELDLPQPMNDDDVLPGEPMPVTSGGKVVGSVEAASEGAEAPKPEPAQPSRPPASSSKEEQES